MTRLLFLLVLAHQLGALLRSAVSPSDSDLLLADGGMVIYAFATYLFSVIARELLEEDPESPLTDDKPPTRATRGDRIPLIIGRERVGPLFAWAPPTDDPSRYSTIETTSSGGKGFGGTTGGSTVWFEPGMHVLCIGPVNRLITIWEDGEVIWPPEGTYPNGALRGNVPSGSTLDCSDGRGSFRIYWGEVDQPLDTTLGQKLGVDSRWANVCFLYWNPKRLGGFPNWQALEYEIEVKPFKPGQLWNGGDPITWGSLPSQLGGSSAWFATGPYLDDADCRTIVGVDESADLVKLLGDQTGLFSAAGNEEVRIRNSTAELNGDYTTASSAYNVSEVIRLPGPFDEWEQRCFDYRTVDSGFSTVIDWRESEVDAVRVTVDPDDWPEADVLKNESSWCYRFTKTGNSLFLPACRAPLLSVGFDPPGGARDEFGDDFNVAEIFVDPGEFVDQGDTQVRIVLGFVDSDLDDFAPGRLQVAFTWTVGSSSFDQGEVVLDSEDQLYSSSAVEVSKGWWRLRVLAHQDDTDDFLSSSKLWLHVGFLGGLVGQQFRAIVANNFDVDSGTPLQSGSSGIWYSYDNGGTGVTTVEMQEDIAWQGDFPTGELCLWTQDALGFQGANGAHMLYQLLFEEYPYGAGLDETLFDIPSLEAVGATLASEDFRSHIRIYRDNDFRRPLQSLMLDLGVMVSWSPFTGKLTFTLVRDEGDIYDVPEGHVGSKPVEVPNTLEGGIPDNLIFNYPNHELDYRTDTVVVNSDGVANTERRKGSRSKRLPTVRDAFSAVKVAQRRAPEDLTPSTVYKVELLRESAFILPGMRLKLPDSIASGEVLRALTRKSSTKDRSAEITAAVDPLSTGIASTLGFSTGEDPAFSSVGFTPYTDPFATTAQDVVEAPELLSEDRIQLIPLWLRGTQKQTSALCYISGNGLTFKENRTPIPPAVGGILDASFHSQTREVADYTEESWTPNVQNLEYGPTFTSSSTDPLGLPTLSEDSFYASKLVAYCDGEWMAVGGVIALGNGRYQVDRAIRGIFGTSPKNLSGGSPIFIHRLESLPLVYFNQVSKDVEYELKLQVFTLTSVQDLSDSAPISLTSRGSGIRPHMPTNLRTSDLTGAFVTGQDVTLRWGYSLRSGAFRRTGAGLQGAGEAVSLDSTLGGSFTLAIIDPLSSQVVRTVEDLTDPEYTYTEANRLSDLGSDRDFRVDVAFVGDDAPTSERATMTVLFE